MEKSYTCNYERESNIENKIYIYSSNIINEKKLILIGVSYPYKNYNLLCKIIYTEYITSCNISTKKLYNIHKNSNLTYIALYISFKTKEKPKLVKLNNNIIPIIANTPNMKYNIILAIVNFHNIANYKQVIDVIEISHYYGVEHIVIHVTSSTVFIKSILLHYVKLKYVELIPFCFNKEMKYVWATGQLEKMNDILYRYMHYSKYIIFNDIDEIIMPLKSNSYISFFNLLDNSTSDMYLFKSKLFSYKIKSTNSIVNYKDCCFIKKGYEKYIIGNIYKYTILDVHSYKLATYPILVNTINESDGYVRHTRYKGGMCKSNMKDTYLDFLQNNLSKIYSKFYKLYNNSSDKYYYGREDN